MAPVGCSRSTDGLEITCWSLEEDCFRTSAQHVMASRADAGQCSGVGRSSTRQVEGKLFVSNPPQHLVKPSHDTEEAGGNCERDGG